MTDIHERLRMLTDRPVDLMELAANSTDARLCVKNMQRALAIEYPGQAGEALWQLIGLPRDEVARLLCGPGQLVENHYRRYRDRLKAEGNTEALERFHRHIDGLYVYVKSGLSDASGFRDLGSWRIDRTDGDFAGRKQLWLGLAGMHAYGLGPTQRAAVEGDLAEQAVRRFTEIGVALRTSQFFGNGPTRYMASSTTYGCMLQLLAGTVGVVPYFTRAGFERFRANCSVEDLRRRSNWDQLYDEIITNRSPATSLGEAERAFGDLVFEGVALIEYSSDLREAVEQVAVKWIDDDGDVDYVEVERTMCLIYEDLERAIEAGETAVSTTGPDEHLRPEMIFERGIAALALDPRSPYSCRY